MIGPKSAHLVERAAERLRQACGLESSAAQLLEPDPARATPPTRAVDAEPLTAAADTIEVLAPEMPVPEVAEVGTQPTPPRPVIDLAALERAGLFDWSRGRSRIAEEFRLAQRQVLRAAFAPTAEAGLANLLMVTSARAGEGKTFTALNLAGSVALQGDHHVLLIDSDSKPDSLCQAL